MRSISTSKFMILAIYVGASSARASTMDFESAPLGQTFGVLENDPAGTRVLSQNRIDMYIEEFHFRDSTILGLAEIGGQFDQFFPTTPLSLDNINVVFDFARLGFAVNQVTIEFQEFGGTSNVNIGINRESIIQLSSMRDLPSVIDPGVTATIDGNLITFTGSIDSVLIGGQELGLDNIVATPEPATVFLLILGSLLALRRSRRAM